MIKKKIVAIKKEGLTSRGNPKSYWVVLECGHVHLTSYSVNIAVKDFALQKNLNPTMRCHDCERNMPINLELLRKYTPYKVWDAQNFSRFET